MLSRIASTVVGGSISTSSVLMMLLFSSCFMILVSYVTATEVSSLFETSASSGVTSNFSEFTGTVTTSVAINSLVAILGLLISVTITLSLSSIESKAASLTIMSLFRG